MKILLPYFDDSTLFFAAKMAALIRACGVEVHVAEEAEADVSDRQRTAVLKDAPVLTLEPNFFASPAAVADFDAVVMSKTTRNIRVLLADERYRKRKNRPKFIAFYPGLEFTPERGFVNRRNFDAIFFTVSEHAELFRNCRQAPPKYISWGHPYFMRPVEQRPQGNGPVYFFAQALSPASRSGREHMVEVLYAMARANPQRDVVVKLRHLPSENKRHAHQERFDYPSLMTQRLPNVRMTACSMEDALAEAGLAITCTSTAAMEAISAGVPTIVYLDYVENYLDPLVAPMRRLMAGSDVVKDLRLLLSLQSRSPNKMWLDRHFRENSIVQELISFATSGH